METKGSRMRWIRLTQVAMLAWAIGLSATIADAAATSFKRGASLVQFLMFPEVIQNGSTKSYANPPYPGAKAALSLFKFDELRRAGFDHMRIGFDAGPMMWGDEAQRNSLLEILSNLISELHRNDLSALVTLFPPSLNRELPETYLDGINGPKFRLYFEMVERIANRLKDVNTGLVAFEPMNEPQSVCRVRFGLDWTAYQEYMVEHIRRIAPELRILLTGGCWSNIEGIVLLETPLLRDRRNLVSAHFYYPFMFTHQSADWSYPYMVGMIGLPYPVSTGNIDRTLHFTRERFKTLTLAPNSDRLSLQQKAETEIRKYFSDGYDRSSIEKWLKPVAEWQERQGIRSDQIVFTEFGAMKQWLHGVEIGRESRARWLNDVTSIFERYGWGWTHWVLRDGPFGIYDRQGRNPDPLFLRALRLNGPTENNSETR
jgi:hypothetical protein